MMDGWTTTIGEHFGARAPTPATNPFVRVEGKVRSVTAISSLIKTNPQHARELCRAAGENTDAWMPENPL